MATRVWDRDEYLARHRVSVRAERQRRNEEQARQQRAIKRGGFWALLKMGWQSFFRLGMYSNDPTLARIAIVHTASQELRNQRQISAAHRAEDEARELERARIQGRAMADAMIERVEERRRV